MSDIKDVKVTVGIQARLLDIRKPDWFSAVKIEQLNQTDSEKCVLAQNYGSYMTGIKELFGSWDNANSNGQLIGFEGGSGMGWTPQEETQEWINAINDRKNALPDNAHVSHSHALQSTIVNFNCNGKRFNVSVPLGWSLSINDIGWSMEKDN